MSVDVRNRKRRFWSLVGSFILVSCLASATLLFLNYNRCVCILSFWNGLPNCRCPGPQVISDYDVSWAESPDGQYRAFAYSNGNYVFVTLETRNGHTIFDDWYHLESEFDDMYQLESEIVYTHVRWASDSQSFYFPYYANLGGQSFSCDYTFFVMTKNFKLACRPSITNN